jgi:hypothetical protein
MRAKRVRYLITFVAAMFIANHAAAGMYASFASVGNMLGMAATQSHAAAMGHPEHLANADALCLAQCIQSYRDPVQALAANGLDGVVVPAISGPCLSVRTEPVKARIAWAPKFAGPKLSILFCNLRN